MTTLELGLTAEFGATAFPITMELELLLRSHLLIQASTGGGKSRTIRRIVEQAFGKVPIIVMDPEGEFASLRERFDFLLVGEGGDTKADVRTAKLLAHRVLELGLSVVIDLFEMRPQERQEYVAAFFGALIDAPKRLWRDYLIVLDEAHKFCPEKGDSPASGAVTDMATVGRKRGYGFIAATQRLAKFKKDTAAELQNRLIGKTTLDIDRERAAEDLGISKADKRAFFESVKRLVPGRFYATGRAICEDTVLVQVGDVLTSHPEPGRRTTAPPPPTAKIRHLLPRLSDLPSEAKDEEDAGKTSEEIARLNAQVKRLNAELEQARSYVPPAVETVLVPDGLVIELETCGNHLGDIKKSAEQLVTRLGLEIADNDKRLETVRAMEANPIVVMGSLRSSQADIAAIRRAPTSMTVRLPPDTSNRSSDIARQQDGTDNHEIVNREGAWRMLRALASRHPKPLTIAQVGTLAGNASTTGTFRQYMAMLKRAEFVTVLNKVVTITPAGLSAAGEVEKPKGTKALLAMWREKIDRKGAREILDLFAREHGPFTKARVTELIGCENTGTFRQYFAKLVRNDLVVKTKGGFVINPELAL